MAKKIKDPLVRIQLKRPMCRYPGCKNKGRRTGKRQYGDHCELHKPVYYAA